MVEHRKWIQTVLSDGTGANMATARRVVSWIRWLRATAKTHEHVAELWGRAVNFVFVNTHSDSLDMAKEIISEELFGGTDQGQQSDKFCLDIEFELIDLFDGDGCATLEEGKQAADAYLPRFRQIAKDCHVMEIVCTVGAGNTGSQAIVPFMDVAIEEGCWVVPFPIKSARSELTPDRLELQDSIMAEICNRPVWATVADNGYFQTINHPWNQAPLQLSYDRIDHIAAHSFRMQLMMWAHPMQIDQSKLKSKIFNGHGGLLSVAGTDVDETNPNLEEEIQRIIRMVIENPMAIEMMPGESNPLEAIEVLVTGVMGGVSGTFERMFMEAIRNHDIITKAKKPVETLHQRFAQYLSGDTSSVFVLITRKRSGPKVDPLRFPPKTHPILVDLRRAETMAMAAITAEELGRSNRQSTFSAIYKNELIVPTDSVGGAVQINLQNPELIEIEETTSQIISVEDSFQGQPTSGHSVAVSNDQTEDFTPKDPWAWVPSFLKKRVGSDNPNLIEKSSELTDTRGNERVDSTYGAVRKGPLNMVSNAQDFEKKYPDYKSMQEIFAATPDNLRINPGHKNDLLEIIALFPKQGSDEQINFSSSWLTWFVSKLRSEGVKIHTNIQIGGIDVTPDISLEQLSRLLDQKLSEGDISLVNDLYILKKHMPFSVVAHLAGMRNDIDVVVTKNGNSAPSMA